MAQDPQAAKIEAESSTKDENAASKADDSKEKSTNETNDLFESEVENKKLTQFINLALDEASGKEWTVFKCKDDRISVKYTKLPNDKLYTIRGQMDIEVDINEFHEYTNGMYSDIFSWEKANDAMATDIHAVAHIDDDHTIVYGSFNAGFGLWPRDFCWMKRRFLFEKFKGVDGKEYRVTGDMCYSVDKNHPHYVEQAKGHVRGWLAMSGNVFVEKDDKICHSSYIVNLDPAGWIPQWVANLVAPEQGLVIKHVYDNYYKIKETMKNRREKENKDKEKEKEKENDEKNDKDENQDNKTKSRAKGVFVEE